MWQSRRAQTGEHSSVPLGGPGCARRVDPGWWQSSELRIAFKRDPITVIIGQGVPQQRVLTGAGSPLPELCGVGGEGPWPVTRAKLGPPLTPQEPSSTQPPLSRGRISVSIQLHQGRARAVVAGESRGCLRTMGSSRRQRPLTQRSTSPGRLEKKRNRRERRKATNRGLLVSAV